MIVKEYFLGNWPLILILLAFVISLLTTVFLSKKTIIGLYILIGAIFVLSVVVFVEFYLADLENAADYKMARTVLAALRYSATPLIISQIAVTLIKKMRWFVFIPALVLTILDIVSIFTGIVFSVDDSGMVHGALWLLPYIMVGLYSVFLIVLLVIRSNKRLIDIIPIAFLAFALGSGLFMPFIYHDAYATIFCLIIAIALFAYYEFSVLQLTKKDSLTGLLNRHAYFADVSNDPKSITALISIDMNGLKQINDNIGHDAGDEALSTLSACFARTLRHRQSGYRVGGDEFIIVCRRTSQEEVLEIVEKIKKNVAETKYTCAIGYSFNPNGDKPISDLLKESDQMMYTEKDKYYQESGNERRQN